MMPQRSKYQGTVHQLGFIEEMVVIFPCKEQHKKERNKPGGGFLVPGVSCKSFRRMVDIPAIWETGVLVRGPGVLYGQPMSFLLYKKCIPLEKNTQSRGCACYLTLDVARL
jgi:hypothetical protein